MPHASTGDSVSQDTLCDPDVPAVRESARPPDRPLERGDVVGRYVILERIGAGGMGVVYAAYDPELDRKIALKRLHSDRATQESRSEGRSRLVREAQAMARLSHGSVVAVHDVGIHDDRVFLAMEYVEGQTLGEFMQAKQRPWREVLAVLAAAGRGLAAAHAAGLVHRDFKPDNVLIHRSGDVKVTDFGLALDAVAGSRDPQLPVALAEAARRLRPETTEPTGHSLTVTGAIMGTPAYMSPEQHFGLPTDARTDQFSFCVVLYEALYGRRPFAGKRREALAVAIAEGQLEEAPAGTKVPGWLRQVVVRGLHSEPSARYPDMPALLEALSKDRGRTRQRWLGSIAAGVFLVGAGIGVAALSDDPEPLCADMGRHLVGVWDDDAKARVGSAIARSGVGFADSTYTRVEANIDRYAAAWTQQRGDACEATQLRGEQSQATMDLRMECLDGRLQALRSLVDILSEADVDVARKAVSATSQLPSLGDCADTAALRAAVPMPDAATAETVAALREMLARAYAHSATGQYEVGRQVAQDAIPAARAAAYPPVLAEALLRLGHLQTRTGPSAEAEATLTEAFFVAVEQRLDARASRAAADLVGLVGRTRDRVAEGRSWAAHARAHADAANDPALRAKSLHALAGLAHRQGEFDEARALATEALELRSEGGSELASARIGSLNLLGLIASDSGHYEQALGHLTSALELGRDVLGPDHPDLALYLNNRARIELRQGQLDKAQEAFERALKLQSHALGPEHHHVAQLHNNLAAVALSRGDEPEAQRRFELALKIWEKALGPNDPKVADGLSNLGVVASRAGRYEDARDYAQRALDIRLGTMDPDHPDVAQSYQNLADDTRRSGEPERARQLHEKALGIWERRLGPEHDSVAVSLTGLGLDLLELGRSRPALAQLERASTIQSSATDPDDRALTRWALARALWAAPPAAGGDHARAVALAQQALAQFEASDQSGYATEARRWLDARE